MSDPDQTAREGGFQAGPPPHPVPDERLRKDAPAPKSEARSFALRAIDVRKKLGPRDKLLLGLFPIALAVGAWFLAGGLVWVGVALGAAGMLLVVAVRYLPSLDFLGRRHFLMFGYFVLCWAVWAAVGYFLPLTTVKVDTGLGSHWEKEPDCPMRIVYGWQVDEQFDRAGEHTIAFRGRFNPESLKIYTPTPTGWVERSFNPYTASVALEEMPLARLYIDNRRHGAVTVGCGQLSFHVAADSHQRLRIAADPTGSSSPVTLDGKEVGTLAVGEDLLLDSRGTRSYQLRKLVYRSILDMVGEQAPGLLPEVEVFRAGQFHKLGVAVDYFLEEAPKEIKLLPFASKETRYELTEIEP